MTTTAQQRAEWLGKHFKFLVSKYRTGAHIAPADDFTSLCGVECMNRKPNFRLEKTCKKCKTAAENLAREEFP